MGKIMRQIADKTVIDMVLRALGEVEPEGRFLWENLIADMIRGQLVLKIIEENDGFSISTRHCVFFRAEMSNDLYRLMLWIPRSTSKPFDDQVKAAELFKYVADQFAAQNNTLQPVS